MDQRTNIVEQDIKDIVQTRLEISRKMQLLDDKARYEWESMKTTLSGLANNVTETGKEFINQSTRTLDPARQMNLRPWVALAGVVTLGYIVGLLENKYRRPRVYPYYPPRAHGAPVMPSNENKEENRAESGVYPYFPEGPETRHQEPTTGHASFLSNVWSDVSGNIRHEVQRSKEAFRYALRQFARDMSKEIVPIVLKSITPQSSSRPEQSPRSSSS